MTLTDEMDKALNVMEHTQDSVFITGKAGTGKTTLLKYFISNTKKRVVVAAPTGVAAINAHGTTLHSLFKIPLGILDPDTIMFGSISDELITLMTQVDTVVIDEISMVRPDTIDYIDKKLKLCRLSNEPFGGIQIIMLGDLYQLPPVLVRDEKGKLLRYYRGIFFFYANIWRRTFFHVFELTHVFRQSDNRFIDILNNIRVYKLTKRDINDLEELRSKYESQNYNNGHIHICAYRSDAQWINQTLLGTPNYTYQAQYEGEYFKYTAACDDVLQLRVGARVMTICNHPNKLYCNGSMGEVLTLTQNSVTVKFDSGVIAVIEPYKWINYKYVAQDGAIKQVENGNCIQIPLTLAWAITVHKSQGLTFDKITLHGKRMFATGQLYVALSRCTSMEGIITDSFISDKMIYINPDLLSFEEAVKHNKNVFDVNAYLSLRMR